VKKIQENVWPHGTKAVFIKEAVTTTQARARLLRKAQAAVKEARTALQDLYGVAAPGMERRIVDKAYQTSKTLWAIIADLKP
jgi:hypothetical protein